MNTHELLISVVEAGRQDGLLIAYLDPGSGSLILQFAIAAVAAVGLTARLWWSRLLVLLRLRKPSSSLSDHSSADQGKSGSDS